MYRPLILVAFATSAAAPPPPQFDPIAFFAGRTEGVGRMKIALGHTRDVLVHGRGRRIGNDTIVLAQTVDRAGKPPARREWRIRRTAPGRYTGTLTDARGPITGETVGGRFHLTYRGKGVAIEQWITAAPGGRSAHNILTARKLGVVVARLDETIRNVD